MPLFLRNDSRLLVMHLTSSHNRRAFYRSNCVFSALFARESRTFQKCCRCPCADNLYIHFEIGLSSGSENRHSRCNSKRHPRWHKEYENWITPQPSAFGMFFRRGTAAKGDFSVYHRCKLWCNPSISIDIQSSPGGWYHILTLSFHRKRLQKCAHTSSFFCVLRSGFL